MNLMRYLEMLKSAEFRDDLDVVSTIHTPKGQLVCSLQHVTSVNVGWFRQCHIYWMSAQWLLSDGGLQRLHLADDDVIYWLEWMAIKVIVKWKLECDELAARINLIWLFTKWVLTLLTGSIWDNVKRYILLISFIPCILNSPATFYAPMRNNLGLPYSPDHFRLLFWCNWSNCLCHNTDICYKQVILMWRRHTWTLASSVHVPSQQVMLLTHCPQSNGQFLAACTNTIVIVYGVSTLLVWFYSKPMASKGHCWLIECVVWSRYKWRRCPWKARDNGVMIPLEKMRVPLPVCHPAVISVLIHNRWAV